MGDDASISGHDDAPDDDAEVLRARDAAWVAQAVGGDPDAFGRLYDAWFDRVHHLARRIVGDADTAAEVTQETFLAAWRALEGLQDRHAFGGWLLRIARNNAYNRSGRERRSRPVDDQGLAMIEAQGSAGRGPDGFEVGTRLARHREPEAAVADAEIVALVHEAVGALGERDGEVLDLQLRGQLSPAEVGEVLDLSRNAANQLCHRVRGRFATAFRARMLWGRGGPSCEELARALATAGVTAFGADAVTVVQRHLPSCEACTEESDTRVRPAALFAAVPLLTAPLPTKTAIAGRLASQGVPMSGSSAHRSEGAELSQSSDGPAQDTGVLDDDEVPSIASGGRPRAWLAAAAVVVVAAVAAFLFLGGDDPGTGELLAGDDTTTTVGPTTSTSSGIAARPGPDPTEPSSATAPDATVGPTTTVTDPTTTTTLAPARIEVFELLNGTDQPAGYPVGEGAPTLRWRVIHAEWVEIRVFRDDGVNGPQPHGLLSVDHEGEAVLCPGQVVDGQCLVDPGTYSYRLTAADSRGGEVTSPDPAPQFLVYQVIL